jgi:hypothetical protein
VDLFLAITQGAGLAVAAGIRPYLPALLAGALASGDALVDFDGTDFAFLEQAAFLIAVVILLGVTVALERRRGPEAFAAGPYGAALAGVAVGIGALLFAGSLDEESSVWWPGLLGGVVCALLAQATVRGLFARASRRLDPEAKSALPFYADALSLVLAVLAVLVPPVSIVIIAALLVLLVQGRRREGEKYAGLRILR